jgi:hypothetical protein
MYHPYKNLKYSAIHKSVGCVPACLQQVGMLFYDGSVMPPVVVPTRTHSAPVRGSAALKVLVENADLKQ